MLNLLLPSEGLYCVATPVPTGGFAHRWWSSIADAQANATAIDQAGKTVYIAQASFRTSDSRKQANAHRVKSFWLDIDCGVGKPFTDQHHGIAGLRAFLDQTGLPLPTVVNSGNGLYTHWILEEEILPDQWFATATMLKKITTAYEFAVDDSRTSDLSSVLRPPGAHNRKHGAKKPVEIVRQAPMIDYSHFASLIQRAADAKKITTTQFTVPAAYVGINDDFTSGIGEGPPCLLEEAEKHCAQLALVAKKLGDVPEPLWYAFIGVARHCAEGEAGIQDRSVGHPDYSPDDTRAKIAQHTLPPTTCQHFGNTNPVSCIGCKHNGKIKTPIVLGRKIEKIAETTVDEERTEMPCGFVVTASGIMYEPETLRIYPYDIYPTKIAWDDSLGYETVTFRHRTPHNGWMTFAMRTGTLHDNKSCALALGDNHVQLVGAEEKKLALSYLEQYTAKLRATRALTKLYAQMGWRVEENEQVFVLGNSRYSKGKTPEQVGFAQNVPEVARAYRSQGDLAAWVEQTGIYAAPDMVAHYFPFLAGAFGAPLLRFTGYEGALISCVGESGTGKTLLARQIQSVYGEPSRLMMLRDDTKNSLVARLGVCGSLPVTIDEVTNIDAMDLSDLVYRITQGRDKARLSRSGKERNVLNHWNTIAITSSNSSLIEKLCSVKTDASAEINRVMEIYIAQNTALDREAATAVYRAVSSNFGLAGPIYIQYITDHADEHREQIDKISAMLVEKAQCRTEERFLVAICATTLYGGLIAHRLGLVKVGMQAVTPWVIEQLQSMRTTKHEVVSDSVSILGSFLTRYAANGIVVGSPNASQPMRETHGQIVFRYEVERGRCFISRDFLRNDLSKQHADYSRLRNELKAMNVLITADKRKTLTAGIDAYPGAQQMCWEIDTTHPALGNIAARVVDKAKPSHLRSIGI